MISTVASQFFVDTVVSVLSLIKSITLVAYADEMQIVHTVQRHLLMLMFFAH